MSSNTTSGLNWSTASSAARPQLRQRIKYHASRLEAVDVPKNQFRRVRQFHLRRDTLDQIQAAPGQAPIRTLSRPSIPISAKRAGSVLLRVLPIRGISILTICTQGHSSPYLTPAIAVG